MPALPLRPDPAPGNAGSGALSGLGYLGRLRDADWLHALPPLGGGDQPGRTQVLHRWNIPAGESAAGLAFLPLDGNPRHGVLALFVASRSELHDAIEILERQGRWLVMPDGARARMLATSFPDRRRAVLTPRANVAGTPDRRFVFFNDQRGGGTVTLVERRQDGGVVPTSNVNRPR